MTMSLVVAPPPKEIPYSELVSLVAADKIAKAQVREDAPYGAIIFADVQMFPKLGLQPDFAARSRSFTNWAAALTWVLTIVFCIGLNFWAGIEVFFLGLPGWFVAVGIYIICSRLLQVHKPIDIAKVETL